MQCAAQSGYNINQMPGNGQMLNLGNVSMPGQMFNRNLSPTIGSIIAMFPYMMQQGGGLPENHNTCASGCGTNETASTTQSVEIDDEMRQRRELKMQMNLAIESENFEKAAELRDRLKELEKVRAEGRITCDSETD